MTHLHEELSKRRDKRLELAARRRDYEVVNLTKRRRLDEDAVWSWWKVTLPYKDAICANVSVLTRSVAQYRRDELQTTMIAETNRKRRKLDRERRALDRPLPGKSLLTFLRVLYLTFHDSSSYSEPSDRCASGFFFTGTCEGQSFRFCRCPQTSTTVVVFGVSKPHYALSNGYHQRPRISERTSTRLRFPSSWNDGCGFSRRRA